MLPSDSSDDDEPTLPAGGFGLNRGYVDEDGGVHRPYRRGEDAEGAVGVTLVSPSLRERSTSALDPYRSFDSGSPGLGEQPYHSVSRDAEVPMQRLRSGTGASGGDLGRNAFTSGVTM